MISIFSKFFLLSALTCTALIIGCGDSTPEKTTRKSNILDTLKCTQSSAKIAIDGIADSAWTTATAIEVLVNQLPYEPSNGYKGMKKTTVSMKSLRDDKNIYFLLQYKDPTKSLERFPWIKQKDGSWKHQKALDSTGHDNTYYEDKVAFLWDINTAGFEKKGCDMSCHMSEDGMVEGIPDTSAGRKYTRPGEYLDIWHWKSVRTNAVYQLDDQYVDWQKAEGGKAWGRHSDNKTAGGYVDNMNETKTGPAFMNSAPTADNQYYVIDKDKVPFKDTYQAGQVLPGIVISKFEGPRGDISAHGKWKNGVWTLEIKRALTTEGEGSEKHDIQFSDLNKPYFFGISIFDNSQINHIYHKKTLQLIFI
ncbi:MAG: ethylbenzene dehydrogenase [Planctomycetes bacterium]|nr:ethylbenzene dehydrogenase [Planctomycetota bacterium]